VLIVIKYLYVLIERIYMSIFTTATENICIIYVEIYVISYTFFPQIRFIIKVMCQQEEKEKDFLIA